MQALLFSRARVILIHEEYATFQMIIWRYLLWLSKFLMNASAAAPALHSAR